MLRPLPVKVPAPPLQAWPLAVLILPVRLTGGPPAQPSTSGPALAVGGSGPEPIVVVIGWEVQPFASVITTLYGPGSAVMEASVAPLLHAYWNGASPTVTIAVAVPLLKPSQVSEEVLMVAYSPSKT